MKRYPILFCLGISVYSYSQSIEFTPSFGASAYYRIFPYEYFDNPNDLKFTTDLSAQYIQKLKKGAISFGINYTNYSGKHLDGSYGFSHYDKTFGDFHNGSLGIQFNIIDRVFKNKLESTYGINLNYRITSSRTGYSSAWAFTGYSSNHSLTSEGGRKFLPFLTYRLAYLISINDKLTLVPAFKTAFGLFKEYDDYRRWSNYLSFGLRYELNAE